MHTCLNFFCIYSFSNNCQINLMYAFSMLSAVLCVKNIDINMFLSTYLGIKLWFWFSGNLLLLLIRKYIN